MRKETDERLLVVTMYGDPKMVTGIVEAGTDVDATNEEGQTALMLATEQACLCRGRLRRRFTRIVIILLRRGASMNVQDHYGRTALDLAVGHGVGYIVGMLRGKFSEVRKEGNAIDDSAWTRKFAA